MLLQVHLPIMRYRKAFFQNGVPAIFHQCCSGKTRRQADRKYHPESFYPGSIRLALTTALFY